MYKFSLKQITVILALVASETVAQSFINNGVTSQFKFLSKNISIIAGMIGYSIVGFLYYKLIKAIKDDDSGSNALNIGNSIWNAGTQITVALVSFVVFGENMSAKNWLGNILMAIGLILVL